MLAIDNVLIDHHAKFIQDAGRFWNHAEQRNKIAHNYLIKYVCASGKPCPLELRRFGKRQQCGATAEELVDHTKLCGQWKDGSPRGKFPATLPPTATSPTPRLSTIFAVSRTVSGDHGPTWES